MNKNDKKIKKTTIIVILLVLTIIMALVFSIYAYSKYKTTRIGEGTSQVAKWSFKVNGQTQTIPDIDLATTMDPHSHVEDGRIAPGTSGHFNLELDATGSEVSIDYSLKLAITEKPTNLRFYTDSGYTKEIASTDGVMNLTGVILLEEVETIQTKTIYWKWPYQTGDSDASKKANDKIDTDDSKKSVTMTITVTGIQRDPSKEEVTAIDELQVGDIINYNPSGTYNWNKEYATSSDTGTQTLSSSTGESFNVIQWKVLSIDKSTGNIEMVPATIPSGKVILQGAQGYNNGVKLLNDVCSNLYGNTTKGIIARSINEEDFVKVGGAKWKNNRASYIYIVQYGNQFMNPSTVDNYYPIIYKEEKNSVINGIKAIGEKLKAQSEQETFISKTDDNATDGYLKASTSIQPYQTYYNTKDYATTSNLLEGYSEILLPDSSFTQYWIASRCICPAKGEKVDFAMYRLVGGYFQACFLLRSNVETSGEYRKLFPVVSLNSQLLEKAADGTYNVK